MNVTVGQLIDSKYKIVRLLGEGGMGAVYEGQNVRIGHRVAIKVLHAELATRGDVLARFEREAQAAGQIGSEHIVEVYDLGELPGGARYMVMEFLDGENLSARVQSAGKLSAQVIAPMMLELLDGLGAAHAAGIIHRDLKPDNIFLVRNKKTGKDFVKIVDFGVSKFSKSSSEGGMSMTRTGSVIGTPYYMSPEQAKGAKLTDHRSDLYSVGVVLFECATGQMPFQADTFNELMFKIVLEPPPDPETLVPGLDPRFAAIIRKAMARDPEARYQDAAAFQQALADWMAGAGVSGGVFAPAPPPRAPMQSVPNIVATQEVEQLALAATGASDAPAPAPALPAPVAASGARAGMSLTAGSLPGASLAAAPSANRKSSTPVIVGVTAAILLVTGGVLALKGRSGPAPAADRGPTVQTSPPPAASAPTVLGPITDPAPSAAQAPAATDVVADAGADADLQAASHGGSSAKPVPVAIKPGATLPSVVPTATASQLKGRTIRTDL